MNILMKRFATAALLLVLIACDNQQKQAAVDTPNEGTISYFCRAKF